MEIQLEINLEQEMDVGSRILALEAQCVAMNETFGKVRRKLFAEIGELKKTCARLKEENENLKSQVMMMKHEKTKWTYKTNWNLFDIEQIA